jgi:hypothetical protein
MKDLYKSKEWNSLHPLFRSELLLVTEGVKRGAITCGNWENFRDIVSEAGLSCKANSGRSSEYPAFIVAGKEDLDKYLTDCEDLEKRYNANPNMRESELRVLSVDAHKVNGQFLGYPDCCTEEYVRELRTGNLKRGEGRKNDKNGFASRFDEELYGQIKETGAYSEIFDYRVPTFTPCSVDCLEARGVLESWQDVLKSNDREAVRTLIHFNRQGKPERFAHKEYLRRDRLNRVRKSRANLMQEIRA